MKQLELMIGARAEQALRDAMRAAEEHGSEGDGDEHLEMAPVGQKDWIAGHRQTGALRVGALASWRGRVLKRLIALSSAQRVREDSLRLWIVPRQVPVFREPDETPLGLIVDEPSPDR